jgi:hypothetical protein
MKKIWLMGGFGNVLFQILVYEILKKNNSNVVLIDNLTKENFYTKFLNWSIWQPIYKDIVNEKKILTVNSISTFFILSAVATSKILNIKFKLATFYQNKIKKNDIVSTNIFGYFQNKQFLKKNKEALSDFGKKLNKLFAKSNSYNTVVHYRRGSFKFSKKFSYYYDEVKNLLKHEDDQILVVTENYEAAKLFFNDFDKIKIISSENALDDFRYLISAKKLYCAPSTFSWWAAHCLNENSNIIMSKYYDELLGVYVKNQSLKLI